MERALITGAAGFIGSHLAAELLRRGWSVTGLDARSPASHPVAAENLAELIGDPRFQFVAGDVTGGDLAMVCEGVRAVFHLAGLPGVRRSWGDRFGDYLACNVLGTQPSAWFALPGASGLPGPARLTGGGEPGAALAFSPHRIDPAQQVLFDVRRDWRPIIGSAGLPTLTGAAQRLLDDFGAAQPSPGDEAAGRSARALGILVAWLGAEAPFHEADVRALAGLRHSVQVRRVLSFLAARDMLIPDPCRPAEPRQHAVQRLLASLPGQIGREAGIWVRVVRGQGRVEHPALAYKTIRNYLAYLQPVLTGWAGRYASLRQVTRQDILDAIDARHGPVIQHRIVALRSLFRALRQERVIFRDPTRGISLPAPARLPQPLPADRVAGLLNRANGPSARFAVALVAIHAVTETDLIRLQTADLDLATGTLIIRRGYRHRIVYLDEVTAALASQWLRHRHQRWPGSRNPHLLVSQQTAADTGPVGATMIGAMFEPLGVRPDRLRQDRILDEARHTADPVHLVRVFGITEGTAINYVHAAHPGRQSVIPR